MQYLIGGLIILIAWILVKSSIQKSISQKTAEKLDNEGINKRMNLVHLQGLELGEGTEVYFIAIKDKVTIQSGKIIYTIDIEQINNVSMQNIANTIADKRFSIKNVVVGEILFGNVGASVGGFTGKNALELKSMIINYIGSDGNTNNIVFIPKYSDVKNEMAVRVANNCLYEIVDNINYVIKKRNIDKPEIVNKL